MCEGKCDGVQWELHFSCADGKETIHDQLLSIYDIFQDYDSGNTNVQEPLPTSLIRGGLAWFRVSSYLIDVPD